MIRVLIVDDHPIVREGVTAVLDRERDIDVVGAADTVGEGLRLAAKFHPDVILLDLKLPDADAVDGVTSFAGKGRGVVVFTAHDTDDDVFRAIRGGARGYLLKGSAAAEIARAIRQVHAGESYLSPRIAAKLVKEADALKVGQEIGKQISDEAMKYVLNPMSRGIGEAMLQVGRAFIAATDGVGVDAPASSCDVSICAGTAMRLTSRPVRSRLNDSMPERVGGGFRRVTMLAPPTGTNARGLWRYQNRSAAG